MQWPAASSKPSGVARICCEERQSWKLGYGALTRTSGVQQLLDD